MRAAERIGLAARTLRRTEPVRVLHRVRLRAQRAAIAGAPDIGAALLRRRTGPPAGWPASFEALDVSLPHPPVAFPVLELLNEVRDLGTPADWDQRDALPLWRFHLHYFEWAFGLRDADAFVPVWRSWRAACRFGRGDAWAPYVASVRAWVFCALFDRLVAPTSAADEFVADLALHAGFIRSHLERDVGGNHVIKNLKALVGLGVFLGGDDLVTHGVDGLRRQLDVQVLDDGGHVERSPSYHCQVLGDLLDVARLLEAAGRPRVGEIDDAIARMQTWLGALLMPDGDVALFNDSVLVGRERIALLGPAAPPTERLTVLAASGYAVMRPDDRIHVVADVGVSGRLPGHAHADCLSFELAVDGRRVIVDSGTSTYQGRRRAHERSTAAHNTVEVDGQDQSELWGSFRVARTARSRLERADVVDGVVEVIASHDGYRRLRGRPRHRRRWRAAPGSLEIHDEVTGAGRHRVTARLALLRAVAGQVSVTTSLPGTWTDAEVATGFGVLLPARVLTVTADQTLPVVLTTTVTT